MTIRNLSRAGIAILMGILAKRKEGGEAAMENMFDVGVCVSDTFSW